MSKKKKSNYNKPPKHKIPNSLPLGFTPVHGYYGKQKVYTDGKRYISPDIDQHNGGYWKLACKISDLWRKSTRVGTYNEDLSIRLGP